MASINKIDLSSITNNSSDVYDIDATTLDGKFVSDFALLNGNNLFTGSENYFRGDFLRVVSPSNNDFISLWADGDGIVIEHMVQETDNAYSRLKMFYSSGFLSEDSVAGWHIGSENDLLGDADNLELYTNQLFMTGAYLTISAVDNDQGDPSNISMHPNLISISADGVEGQVYISAGPGPSYIQMYDDNLSLHMECETGYKTSHFNAYTIQLSAFDHIGFYVSNPDSSVFVTGGKGLWINGKETWHKGNLTFQVTDNGTTLEITTK